MASEDIELTVPGAASGVMKLTPFVDQPPPANPVLRLGYFFRSSEGIAILCVLVYFVVGAIYYTQAQGFTLLNALYYSLGIVTTVGFQDASMAFTDTSGGRVFTAFYAVGALVIVWVALLMLIRWFVRRREALFNQTVRKALHHFVSRKLTRHISHQLDRFPRMMQAWAYVQDSVVTQNAMLVLALMVLGVGVVTKTERTTFVNAFHWVISVATTTGLDNTTVVSRDGRIFALFWVIPMVASMAGLLTAVGQWVLHIRYRDIEQFFAGVLTSELMKKFDRDHNNIITRDEWLVATLVAMGKVTEDEVGLVLSHFNDLDTDRDNLLQMKELEALRDWRHADTHAHPQARHPSH